MKLRGLYALTPEEADGERLAAKVRSALAGRIVMLQFRDKRSDCAQRLARARRLAELCRAEGVPFLVNDEVALALECGADGVHLGREDGDIAAARSRLPGRILGVSCYDSLEAARAAVAAGADYVAFGSVYASPTKPGAVRAPLALFAQARALGVPLAAIGGITLERAPELLGAGADLLAVVSDLFDAPDITERALAYREMFR